jgi:peptidoglycan/xylan/chitin deacetylase (PgdA/CDA1 family)
MTKHGCTVLMYHATHQAPEQLQGADAHYAVQLDVFESHLDLMRELGMNVQAVELLPALRQQLTSGLVGMTFDDGHVTNLDAARSLARRGWSGTFFINPATVGTPGYLSWPQLKDMCEMGMSIQSHALHHRYQDELSTAEQFEELSRSRQMIEAELGQAVTTYAPPGGRTSRDTVRLAQQAGYAMMNTSRVGVWRMGAGSPWDVPRFAVLANTGLPQLSKWITQDRSEVNKQVLRYSVLRTLKSILGNQGYERLRQGLLGTSKDY